MIGATREDPRLRDVLLLAIAVAGLTGCITLLYLGMRAVMDVGGACADGGPYVSAQPCPDGTPAAMLLGAFGLFAFGGLGMVAGSRIGGYAWLPLLAWTGLFATLGWNFLEYGVINPPAGQGIEWGYAIPGVLFELMAWAPVVFVVATLRETPSGVGRPAPVPAMPIDARPPAVQPGHRVEAAGPARREQLQAIDALLRAAVIDAAATTPADPARRAAGDPRPGEAGFSEGTQALLDRLERLGDMRDRGLLTTEEYDTAKDAVVHELEARS